MQISAIPTRSLKGWRVIPNLNALLDDYQSQMGQERGRCALDKLPVSGWRIVFDLRDDGLADGFVCERKRPDGSVSSVSWKAAQIHAVYPPVRK